MKALEKSPATRSSGRYLLRLFVAGASIKSREAVLRVRQLCEAEAKGTCKLEVIDIYQQPRLARDNQIIATPTLIRESPAPVRRFIGNLLNAGDLFSDSRITPRAKVAS
jgi:circadian clock protein KaiB